MLRSGYLSSLDAPLNPLDQDEANQQEIHSDLQILEKIEAHNVRLQQPPSHRLATPHQALENIFFSAAAPSRSAARPSARSQTGNLISHHGMSDCRL
jgi:hypothetical protein